jgi:hypothetical protein
MPEPNPPAVLRHHVLSDTTGRRRHRLVLAGRVVTTILALWLAVLILGGLGLQPLAGLPLLGNLGARAAAPPALPARVQAAVDRHTTVVPATGAAKSPVRTVPNPPRRAAVTPPSRAKTPSPARTTPPTRRVRPNTTTGVMPTSPAPAPSITTTSPSTTAPGQTRTPPGQTRTPPGQTKTEPGPPTTTPGGPPGSNGKTRTTAGVTIP